MLVGMLSVGILNEHGILSGARLYATTHTYICIYNFFFVIIAIHIASYPKSHK